MIYVLALSFVAYVCTVWLFLREIRQRDRDAQEALVAQGKAFHEERRELLTRIQRPDLIPVVPQVTEPLEEPEPDERDLAGTITE